MASDIETLIRQALARQNAFDPAIRGKIYQSSRNALARLIVKSGAIDPSVIEKRSLALEQTIANIEMEFTGGAPTATETVMPAPAATQSSGTSGNFSPEIPPQIPSSSAPTVPVPMVEPEQQFGDMLDQNQKSPALQREPALAPAPGYTHDDNSNYETNSGEDLQDYAIPTPNYTQPRQRSWRPMNWVVGIALLGILGWIGYVVLSDYFLPRLAQSGGSSQVSPVEAGSISLLEPNEPDALITAGRGTASIIDSGAVPVIRITSVRSQSTRDKSADPILLEIAPGILKNIAGKKVRVEIRAKSGGTGPATFAISCQFGALGDCGRKRFRVGLQPETIIFTIAISDKYTESQQAFLAINTDVTSAAKLNGVGAAVDFIYARLNPEASN